MVDTTLGIIQSGNGESSRARNPTQSMAFLFVNSARQIVGFLLAERITSKTDKISKAKRVLDNKKDMSETSNAPVMYELDEHIQSKVCTGISRIWVRSDHQRRGIGSRLVEAMRKHFVGSYHILSPEEFAFSHTTPNGSDFAINYMTKHFKRMEFLAYAPELEGALSKNSIDKCNEGFRL